MRELLDALVIAIDSVHEVLYLDQIALQHLLVYAVQLQLVQPLHVGLRPVALGIGEYQAVPQAEGQQLLLVPLEVRLDIVPHPDVFLDLIVLLCGNVHSLVAVVLQAFRDVLRVPLVRLDAPVASLYRHRRRREYDAHHITVRQVVIQRIAQASRLIAADELRPLRITLPQVVNVLHHQQMIRLYRLHIPRFFLALRQTAQCKICLMYVHSNVNCGIILHV